MKGNIYHILNRGIEKGTILHEPNDYKRFILGLYKFNNQGSALRLSDEHWPDNLPAQNKIVEILAWSLMPNHYHLLIQENIDGGAINFVKRIGNGYTKYFNIKNNRSGYLFQNAAKIILVERNEHFLYLPFYINANPIDLIEPEWKTRRIKDKKRVIDFLEKYQWSSYRDHMGILNFPHITNTSLFYEVFDTNQKRFKADFQEWLGDVNLPR
ncbi:transposase [Patescibacteria group bacterium]|nr:transposase [Patescibacteria group bacterium]